MPEKLEGEGMFDTLHAPYLGKQRKPRTYRKKAPKAYLSIAKQRNPRKKTLHKAMRRQLNDVHRGLKPVETLSRQGGWGLLGRKQYRDSLVIQELHRQHLSIFERTRAIERITQIVSIQQPHIRQIVRGKSNARVEFGAKLSVSVFDGFSFFDELKWDAYHEGNLLQESMTPIESVTAFIRKPSSQTRSIGNAKTTSNVKNMVFS